MKKIYRRIALIGGTILLLTMVFQYAITAKVEASSSLKATYDFLDSMGPGWCLGNTLESIGQKSGKDPYYYETAWGNPITTQEIIQEVKNAGFGSVRIPVTYYQNMDSNGTISKEWLNRIEEVVQYVLNSGMYCIIDIHHDTGRNAWIKADANNYNQNRTKILYICEQIADHFRNYDHRLIFEAYNECINPNNSWDSANASEYATINRMNQDFVDIVRETGGNNATRYLITNVYGSIPTYVNIANFTVPRDSIANRLIVGMHSYVASSDQINERLEWAKTFFINKGIPVILGEFGLRKIGDNISSREMYAYRMSSRFSEYHIPCFWWDNGQVYSGDDYSLLDRNTLTWKYPTVVKAIMDGNKVTKKNVWENVVPITTPSPTPKPAMNCTVTDYTGTYDGQPHTGQVQINGATGAEVYYSADTLLDQNNYMTQGSLTCPGFTDAGEHKVYYYAKARRVSSQSGEFTVTILPKEIQGEVKLEFDQVDYTGKEQTPSVTIDGFVAGKDFTCSYENNLNVGTAKVYINGCGNYTGILESHFTINKGPQLVSVTTIKHDFIKNGTFNIGAKAAGTLSYYSSKPEVATIDEKTGLITMKAVGSTVITLKAASTANYRSSTRQYTVVIRKATQSISASDIETVYKKDAKLSIGAKAKTSLAFASSNKKVAIVSKTGVLTIKGIGTTNITIKARETAECAGAKKVIKLSVWKTKKNQTITVASVKKEFVQDQIFQLGAAANGKLTYATSDAKVAVVGKDTGKIKIKGIGTATITIKAAETSLYHSAEKKIVVTITPKAVSGVVVESPSKGVLKMSWTKDSGVTGYELQVTNTNSFTGKSITDLSGSNKKAYAKNLKTGTTYKARIRCYTVYKGKKIYSSWSLGKSVTIK